MNSSAMDIKGLLETISGLSLDSAVDLFVGFEPSTPDNCVTVYDTGGFEPASGYNYERPTIMVRIRNRSYTAGYDMAHSIKEYIHDLHNQTIGSWRYIGIWCMGDINPLGVDANNRSMFTINFRIHRTITT